MVLFVSDPKKNHATHQGNFARVCLRNNKPVKFWNITTKTPCWKRSGVATRASTMLYFDSIMPHSVVTPAN